MANNANPFTNYRIKINFTRREPDHTGYCSDPGSDVGEEYTGTTTIKVRKNTVLHLARINAVNDDNSISIDTLIKNNKDNIFNDILKYNEDDLYCNQGSGYCGYTGYSWITSITIFKKINLVK
tara:strand:- start:289 stop:657 length:369 start_codon:yes stop_codon:yes gene_type:complete